MQKTQTKKKYSAKTVATVSQLSEMRQWLRLNCKSRWVATNFKGELFNWRLISKNDTGIYNSILPLTVMVHFTKPEDLMLYMLSWPSEVLLND